MPSDSAKRDSTGMLWNQVIADETKHADVQRRPPCSTKRARGKSSSFICPWKGGGPIAVQTDAGTQGRPSETRPVSRPGDPAGLSPRTAIVIRMVAHGPGQTTRGIKRLHDLSIHHIANERTKQRQQPGVQPVIEPQVGHHCIVDRLAPCPSCTGCNRNNTKALPVTRGKNRPSCVPST